MKRLLWLVLLLTALMSLFVIFASADVVSGTCGDNLTWELDGATDELVIYGEGPMYDYTASKSAPWYPHRWGIKKVTICDGVTTIGNYAFRNTRALETVAIPDSVTRIGTYAFCDSDLLTGVVIPDSVITIGEYAFSSCNAMANLVIGNGVTTIGDNAFSSCTLLQEVYIPASVTDIGDYAFGNGINMTKIVVADGNLAYESLDGVLFTEDMKILIAYPAGKQDGKWIIPDGVITIGLNAFWNNDILTEVIIPDSVTIIESNAFSDSGALTNVNIGQGVTTIDMSAFAHCTSLSSVTIPASATSVDSYAFVDCQSLTEITVAEENTVYESLDGVLFSEDMRTLLIYPAGKQDTFWRIPDNVMVLGEGSFSYNTKLRELAVPASITTITNHAFSHSSTMTVYYYGTAEMWGHIAIGTNTESVTENRCHYMNVTYTGNADGSHIKADICSDCSVVLGQEVEEPCKDENQNGLCDLCAEEPTILIISGDCGADGDNVKWKLTKDGALIIYGTGAMADYTSYDVPWYPFRWFIRSVTIEDGVTAIGDRAFKLCVALTDVKIPDSVTAIGMEAFYDCGMLTSLNIPDSVTDLGTWIFFSCESLSDVTLGDGMTTIPDGTFCRCDSFTCVVIPEGITKIGESAYASCANLARIVIPEGVTTIEEYMLESCSALTEVAIPASVTRVEDCAFRYCYDLTDVYYYGNREQCDSISFGSLNRVAIDAEWHFMVKDHYNPENKGTHIIADTCTVCGVMFGETVTEDCLDENEDYLCELCGGCACTHGGGSDLVYVSNNDGLTHHKMLCCVDCLFVFDEVKEEPCAFSNGICTKCGTELEKIEIAGSNMNLDNALKVNLLFKKADLPGTGLTAIVTHQKADGSTKVFEFAQADWDENGSYYLIPASVAAKEMADRITIEIVDANGNVYNDTYSTSVREYAGKALASSSTSDYMKILVVDMLNYGAAAQMNFGYNTDDLANKDLTEEQQAIATADVECGNFQVKGTNCYGSNLNLAESIEMNVFFSGMKNKDIASMYAIVAFTNWRGEEKNITVPSSEFMRLSTDVYGVVVDDIVLADARQLVTVTMYNADGTIHGSGSDSVESYVNRGAATAAAPLYESIMKAAVSAYNYLSNR